MTLHTRRESHAYPTSAELGLVVGATQRRPGACCFSRVAAARALPNRPVRRQPHGTHRPNAPTEAELSLAHEVRAYAHSFTLTRRTRVRGSASDHGS